MLRDQRTRSLFATGIVLCFLGAICFSTKAIFVKLAYRETQVDAIALLALRMVFALPFFVVSAAVGATRRSNIRLTPKQWFFVALVGCLGYYISSLLDFIGLQYISAGIERLILFIYPTLVLLISAVMFRQPVKLQQWVALVFTYAGLLLAFAGEIQVEHRSLLFGSMMVFACAFTFAAYIIGSGRLIPVIGAAKFNSYAMCFACTGVLIHFFSLKGRSLLGFEGAAYGYSALMAVVSTVIPSYLISEGIKRVGPANAAIIGTVGPVSTIVQAYYLLGEPFSPMQGIGTLFILGGVLVIGRGGRISG
jgi:drug/metabolite transporter (DMT)-like permease